MAKHYEPGQEIVRFDGYFNTMSLDRAGNLVYSIVIPKEAKMRAIDWSDIPRIMVDVTVRRRVVKRPTTTTSTDDNNSTEKSA